MWSLKEVGLHDTTYRGGGYRGSEKERGEGESEIKSERGSEGRQERVGPQAGARLETKVELLRMWCGLTCMLCVKIVLGR